MNSFRTDADTRRALEAYPQLAVPGLPLCFLQNQEPKLRVDDTVVRYRTRIDIRPRCRLNTPQPERAAPR